MIDKIKNYLFGMIGVILVIFWIMAEVKLSKQMTISQNQKIEIGELNLEVYQLRNIKPTIDSTRKKIQFSIKTTSKQWIIPGKNGIDTLVFSIPKPTIIHDTLNQPPKVTGYDNVVYSDTSIWTSMGLVGIKNFYYSKRQIPQGFFLNKLDLTSLTITKSYQLPPTKQDIDLGVTELEKTKPWFRKPLVRIWNWTILTNGEALLIGVGGVAYLTKK